MNDSSNNFSQSLPMVSPLQAGLLDAGLARLDEAMRREIASKRLPGASILIARGGKVGYRSEFGLLRPDGPVMRSDAIFRIYSMTKPIVSVALMMLVEEGRLLLSDPLTRFIPEFAAVKVGVETGDKLELVPLVRAITVQDLLRHTSGLTYGFTGDAAVQRLYAAAPLRRRDRSSAEFIETLLSLPLHHQPGTAWEYSHSTDVIGRIVEIVSGQALGDFLRERLLKPLGMRDTDFFARPEKHERLAEPFDKDPDTGAPMKLMETRTPPRFEAGGSGLVSTIDDYARFAQMLLAGGALNGVRVLSRKTVEFMTANHLAAEVKIGTTSLLPPGNGFGLGFAVRQETGMSPTPGAIGEYFWNGVAGTAFFVTPKEDLFAILMIQAQGQREYYRALFRNLVYAAIA
jgi:CubicO group peptidase (beta-lactamase class C family)